MDEIEFVEKYLNIKLLEYQKILLKKMIENPNCICWPRGHVKWGREALECLLVLNELKN